MLIQTKDVPIWLELLISFSNSPLDIKNKLMTSVKGTLQGKQIELSRTH